MTFWFFILGVPLAVLGGAGLADVAKMREGLRAFPRHKTAGWVLCAIAWAWTAWECHIIGIDVFDQFLKAFPGELPILAVVLTVLTCWWMPNLLPVRGLCGLLMLFPGQMFPAIRLCDTEWRLALVVFAYVCAALGMWGMFYPWHMKRLIFWTADSGARTRAFSGALAGVGALFLALGGMSAAGVLK